MNQASSLAAIPPTQNTAPVFEFRCLYTQDIRRKAQKRWHDGRLTYHVFNRKIMVYDERSNFLGNAHWQGNGVLAEGEELRLDKGGIEVEVGDCTGRRDQDVSEIVGKLAKEKEDRAAAKAANTTPLRPQTKNLAALEEGLLKRKPLHAVIGTPSGHYGRAMISNVSPFDQKQLDKQDENAINRPAKRQKRSESTISRGGYAQTLTGTALHLGSQRPNSAASIRYEPFRSSIQRAAAQVIDVTIDEQRIIEKGRNNGGVDVGLGPHVDVLERNLDRYPQPRSTYASNLTGAVLSLGPSTSASNAIRNTVSTEENSKSIDSISSVWNAKQKATTKGSEHVKTDSSEIQRPLLSPKGHTCLGHEPISRSSDNRRGSRIDTPHEIQPAPELISNQAHQSLTPQSPASKLNTMQPRKQSTVSNASAGLDLSAEPFSSSPLQATRKAPALQYNSIHNEAAKRTTERPVSTLRIKPRPQPKLMMLMGRPSTRSRQSSSSHGSATSSVELSKTSARLSATTITRSPLQHSVHARRPNIQVEDLSSSPDDKGIDHQIIDDLLTDRSIADKHVVAVSRPSVDGAEAGRQVMESDGWSCSRRSHYESNNKYDTKLNLEHTSTALAEMGNALNRSIGPGNAGHPAEHTASINACIGDEAELPKNTSLSYVKAIGGHDIIVHNIGQTAAISTSLEIAENKTKELPVARETNIVPVQNVKNEPPLPEQRNVPVIDISKQRPLLKQAITTPYKRQLMNPTTRGQPVQDIAKRAVDLAAHRVNITQKGVPPPIGAASTLNARRTLGRAIIQDTKSLIVESSAGGPWSRESFDLFGTWRPPNRDLV